jgi:FMN phosphatase YigB (HAD superfamily)
VKKNDKAVNKQELLLTYASLPCRQISSSCRVELDKTRHQTVPDQPRHAWHYIMHLESYDLFDTLITRITRQPAGVFRLLGCSDAVEFRCKLLEFVPFHVWRRQAERLARLRSSREDIRLVDIYRLLGWIIRHPARVMRREMALENAVIVPVADTIAQLAAERQKGTPCCVISDMYLPQRFLEKIVRRHVGNVPVYVSSALGVTKGSGHLFQHVAAARETPLSDIHHSGDNPVADYAVPLRLGMNASLIPIHAGGASAGALDTLKCPQEDDPFFEMGFRVAGPTAFVMAAHLAEQVAREKPPNVIFGARDTHLVLYAFKQLSDYASTHYCRISRSAVYRAQFHATGNPERFFEGISTGLDFFARLGVPCPPELADLSPRRHRRLFLAATREKNFVHKCEREFEVVRDYLRHEGFQSGTWFVDIGWRGSIQQAINEILAPERPILGWYLGTRTSHLLWRGLYFNGSRPYRRMYRVIQAIAFVELVFMEATPSLARITRADGANNFNLVFTDDDPPGQQAARLRIAEGARAFLDAMVPIHKTVPFRMERLLRGLDDLYDRYLMTPPDHWINALESTTHSGGFGGTVTRLLVGDDTATLLGLLHSEWQRGYIAKHADSPWTPLWRAIHNPLFFIAYGMLKKYVHRYQAWRQQQAG